MCVCVLANLFIQTLQPMVNNYKVVLNSFEFQTKKKGEKGLRERERERQ